MGDNEFRPSTVKAASTRLRTLLHNKAVLLVLDDVWETEHALPLNVGGSNCQVLITTREKAIARDIEAEIYEVDVMTCNQAIDLLQRKIKWELQETDLKNAEILAKEVGYLPLALKLAGVLIDSGTPWKELIEDLQAEIAHLEALEYPEADEIKDDAILKQICLRASFALSLRRLSGNSYTYFIWLGVLHEDVSISPTMVATLWGLSTSQARKTLQYLSDRALLFSESSPDHTLIYRMHDLLRDFACNLIQASSDPTSPRELVGLGLTLSEAHTYLLERYKQHTKAGLWHTLPSDGYIHTYLTWHMQKAGKEELIHVLLKEETQEGQNGWYQTCERQEETARFLSDVNLALTISERNIGLQARYALIIASFMSLVKSLPPSIVFELIKHNIWSLTQGLTYARQIPGFPQRIDAMITLLPLIEKPLRNNILKEILMMAQTLEKREEQMQMFIKLAPYLPEKLLSDTLKITQNIQDETKQAEIFIQLAPHLSKRLLRYVLTAIQNFHSERDRATVITGLSPHLPLELLKEAIRISHTIKDTMVQMCALAGIFEHLSPELQAQLLDTLQDIRDVTIRAKVLGMFAPYFPQKSLNNALAIAREISHERIRVEAFIGLIPYLPEESKGTILREALDTIKDIQRIDLRSDALIKLAPYLPESLLNEARDITELIRDKEVRINTQIALQQQIVRVGLKNIQREPLTRLKCSLEKLVALYDEMENQNKTKPHLPLPKELFEQILHFIKKIQDKEFQMEILINLLPYFSKEILQFQTKLFDRLPSYWTKRECWTKVLSTSNSEIILRFVQDIGDPNTKVAILSEIIPYLPEHRKQKILQDILAAIQSIRDKGGQIDTLIKLLPYFSETLLQQVLDIIESMKDDEHRAKILTDLAPYLSESLLQKVLASAQTIGDQREYIKILLSLRLYLPKELRKILGDKLRSMDMKIIETEGFIFPVQQKLSPLPYKGSITRRLLNFLNLSFPQTMLSEMITSARYTYEPQKLLTVLRRCAPYLSKRSLQKILSLVQEISNESLLKDALSVLYPYLSNSLLKEALLTVQNIQSVNFRTEALVTLAPYLSEESELLNEALNIAQTIELEKFRIEALVAIVQYMSDEMFLDTLPIIQAIEDKDARTEAFRGIAFRLSNLPHEKLWPLWENLLKRSLYHPRPDILEELRVLLPVIKILGEQEAMIKLSDAIQDVGRWWS